MTPPYPGTWQVGDDPGHRQFALLEGSEARGFDFEAGGRLEEVTVAYETWGSLNEDRSNAILVLHALTGDSHVAGPAGPGHPTPGWWDALVGPGAAMDTDRFFVVCPNVLGGCQGTTGPSSKAPDGRAYGSRFPIITIRDQVLVEAALADRLGIERWAGVVGGSMGGMRALEWCVTYPERVERAVVVAVGAAASAEQIALCSLQIRAIRSDPDFAGGDYYDTGRRPVSGLAIARGIGQVSYRTSSELHQRFDRSPNADEDPLREGRYAIESYLEYHGEKLSNRFDPNSYVVLSDAMNHHDVGRGRGGIERALAGVEAEVTVAGIATDRLYPLAQQHELVRFLPSAKPVHVVESLSGHDGFLLEHETIGALIADALGR